MTTPMPKKQDLKNKCNYVGNLTGKIQEQILQDNRELGLLLQALPVRIVTFVETPGSHLKTTLK